MFGTRHGTVALRFGCQHGTYLALCAAAWRDGEELCQLVLIGLLKLSPPVNCCYTCSVELRRSSPEESHMPRRCQSYHNSTHLILPDSTRSSHTRQSLEICQDKGDPVNREGNEDTAGRE
ncbi:uncharacterized [Tachysurus ichikawai]